MHFCHQSVVPGAPHSIVDLELLGVLRLEGTQVVWGVHGGRAASGVGRNDCREVVDGAVGSCHAKSIGIVLHVNGDVPHLLLVPSFLNQEGDESGRDILPEFWRNSSLLCFVSPLVSLPSVEYRASRASSTSLLSSGIVSPCITSLQYGVFGRYFNGFFVVMSVGLVETACNFVCSIKHGQDNGAVDGEVGMGASGEPWAGAGINKLMAVQALGSMSSTLSGRGEKHTAFLS